MSGPHSAAAWLLAAAERSNPPPPSTLPVPPGGHERSATWSGSTSTGRPPGRTSRRQGVRPGRGARRRGGGAVHREAHGLVAARIYPVEEGS